MGHILMIRALLVLLILTGISLTFKIFKAIKIEKRIMLYSLDILSDKELSYFDKLGDQYRKLVKRFRNNEKLLKYSECYDKYTEVGNENSAIGFIIIKLILAIIFVSLVIIFYAIKGKMVSFFGFILSFIFGYYVFDIYLIINKRRRLNKIKNDMLRAVIIMNNAFKAGKSTLQAVKIASVELPYPIAYEFEKIYQDMSYGLSVDVAFTRFAKRVKLEEATYIASVLTILNRTGGNIINVFTSIEKTLFDKKKLEEDLKNSTAASNLVVKVLMTIPFVFAGVIYIVSPTYFNPLFSSTLGYFIIVIMIIMFSIFIYFMNKIMKIKI